MIIIILIGYLFTVLISINNKNYSKKKNINSQYFRIITHNYIFAMIYLFLFIYFFKNIIFNNNDTNTLLEIGKTILYLLFVDFLFYWYHRTVHRNEILKKKSMIYIMNIILYLLIYYIYQYVNYLLL